MDKKKFLLRVFIIFIITIIMNISQTYATQKTTVATFIKQIANNITDVVSGEEETVNIQCEDEAFYNFLVEELGDKIDSKNDDTETIIISKDNIEQVTSLGHVTGNNLTKGINKITGIEKFTNLESLYLRYNKISDLSPIKDLTNLKYLNIENNNITDISALRNLTNLKQLELPQNEITDISNLNNLINLEKLIISENAISNSGLKIITENMPKLEALYVSKNNIDDITGLSKLTNLKELSIAGNTINDISELEALDKLEKLYIQGNQISDLTALRSSKNSLKCLNLGASGFANLYTSFGGNNLEISDLNILTEFDNLKELRLDYLEIINVADLPVLPQIEKLTMKECKISNIDGIQHFINLVQLEVDRNQIQDISPANLLRKLETFSVRNNKITLRVSDENEIIELPQIVKAAKEEESLIYTEDDLILKNCEIQGNKIKIVKLPAKITIGGEKALGTTVMIERKRRQNTTHCRGKL